jgi:hypothetical protein
MIFIRPSREEPYYVIGYGGCPHRFPHNNFSSVYRVFTKLCHMITLWKGKNSIYFGSLGQRSRSIEFLTTGSFPHDNFCSVYWIFTNLDHMISLWKGKNPIYFGVIRSMCPWIFFFKVNNMKYWHPHLFYLKLKC